MANSPKEGKLLYHLTAIENLENILYGGLSSRGALTTFVDVADKQIIQKRTENKLNNFIPFHFFAGSPFAGAVQRRYPDTSFVFITVSREFARLNNFKVLTQHPLSLENCKPESYLEGIENIDWKTMGRREYSDRYCCEICMAECLSPDIIKASNFFSVYTKTAETNAQVTVLRNKVFGYEAFKVNTNKYLFVK